MMADLPNWNALMRQRGWLSHTPAAFQNDVLERCRLQVFKAGEPIYQVGDPPGGMYGLLSGGLRVSVAPGERGPYFGHFARPGAWFGEAAAITGLPRRIGLMASRASEVLHLPLHEIDRIVSRTPAAWRMFAVVTIGHLDTAMGACDDLMIRDHVERLVAVLLRLGGCGRASELILPTVEIDLSQDDVAVIANVARTTASAVLRRLEQAGHVELLYRRIRILAPAALRAMVHD